MAIANVVLNTKTYTPQSSTGSKVVWAETSGGVPTGFSLLSMELRNPPLSTDRAKAGASPFRVTLILDVPVVATEDTDCVCAGGILRWERCRIQVEIPQNGTTAERTDVGLRIKDLLANAQVQATLANLVMPA